MTLEQLTREIGELSVRNERVKSDVKGWINRAQLAICERRNWNFMHSQQSVTIASGQTSGNMPANFKELAPERSPIIFTAPGMAFPTPVRVMSRAQLDQIAPYWSNFYTSNSSGYWTPFYVFIERDDGGLWTINVPVTYPAAQNATYNVSCYLYAAPLVLATDSNGLTASSELCEALIKWVAAKAYQMDDPTDPKGAASMALYNEHIERASIHDARQRIAGRPMHW